MAAAAGVSTDPTDWGSDCSVDKAYKGPHVSWPLRKENVEAVLHHFRTQPDVPLHPKYMAEILGKATVHFRECSSVYDMQVPEDGKLVICGDTHGQLADFLWILKQNGEPSPNTAYLLNGDIADRGEYACEILVIVLLYMLLYPGKVTINRGNHENLEMNRRPADYGGGFYDEVVAKYSPALFMMFQQFFEQLPLATVIAGRVVVVHGGLTRREGVQIQHLRTINRRRQCPTATDAIEDALMFDLMWADPQDQPGVARAPHRGANCVRFGPDVTKRFLGVNGLSLVIRSHEVPENLRGFEDRHDGRLITVFSASNYCGSTGNYGAVVVFQADLSYTVEEHMAPDLSELVAEYSPTSVPLGLDSAGKEGRVDRTKLADSMHEEVIGKLRQKVMQHKDDLWWYWTQLDPQGTGRVSAAVWRQGMAAGLQLDLPWFSLQKDMVEVAEDGSVDYRTFLGGVNAGVQSQGFLQDGWELEVANKAFEALVSRDMTLQQTLATFDQDGDGMVSAQEFREAIAKSNVSLPDNQVKAILRAIEKDSEGQLSVEHFLERFQVVCSLAGGGDMRGLEGSDANLMDRIGRMLIGSGSRVQVFQTIDVNKDGYVDESEFNLAMERLGARNPSMSLTQEERKRAWHLLDMNQDGHLNYLEFCSAFKVVDKDPETTKRMVKEVVDSILAALQVHSGTLSFAFRYLDPKNLGRVSKEDFKVGMRALNASMQGAGVNGPLTDEQLEVFAEFADSDGDGNIDYQEFLAAFKTKKGAGSRPGSSAGQ